MLWLALIFMALCAAGFVALPFIAKPRDGGVGMDLRGAAIAGAALIALAGGAYAVLGEPDVPSAPAAAQSGVIKQLSKLVTTLRQHLRETPDDAEGWRVLGWTYFQGERFADSAAAYAQAAQLRPENAMYRSALGEALVGAAQGEVTPQAAAAFRDALQRDPKDVRARYYLGQFKAQNNDANGAIADWLALYAEAKPGSDEAADLRRRIQALASANNIDIAGRLGPDQSAIDAAADMSATERAAMIDAMVTTLDQKLRANPHNLDGWAQLVRARKVQGKDAEANEALARARAAFAGDPASLARIEEIAAESGLH